MKYRQKIDKAASDQLERILGTFPKSWMLNSEKSQDGEYCFDGFADSDSVSLGYDAKKQLLGGVYSLVFNLTRENILWDGKGEARLCYKGRMIKGDAYFTAGKSDPSLSAWLNTQSKLVRLLSELDLLSMYVSVKNEVLQVRLAPLGGAFYLYCVSADEIRRTAAGYGSGTDQEGFYDFGGPV